MIKTVYTSTVRYTSESDTIYDSYSTVLNCTFEQTSYGSVIIDSPIAPNLVELYPQSITHIIHKKE